MPSDSESKQFVASPVKAGTRNAAIDHIRIFLTVLVIFHHVAIVYGGSGSWYWRELPNQSSIVLLMFNAINQAFFMGFFFLLAGYYTPVSFRKKGIRRYLSERFLRLGVPLLTYFFVLAPLTVALARTSEGHAFWSGWWEMILEKKFHPGPLWFAEALLLFALGYAIWMKFRSGPSETTDLPSFRVLALVALAIGITSFLVRLVMPVGKELAWMQLGYFPAYLFLFVAGCRASHSCLLDNITFRQARPWMIVSVITILTCPAVILLNLGQGEFEGGWSSRAIFYALWDPFVAWGVILGMLWTSKTYCSTPTPVSSWLARHAYGAYIVHPPVVVSISLLAGPWMLHPLVKFGLVGFISCTGSFLAAVALGLIPGARKVL